MGLDDLPGVRAVMLEAFGPIWGPRLLRPFLIIALLAVFLTSLAVILHYFKVASDAVASLLAGIHLPSIKSLAITMGIILGAIVLAIAIGFAWRFIRSLSPFGRLLTLRDAAQIVYDETRHDLVSQIARDTRLAGYADPVTGIAHHIFQHVNTAFGSVKGSTIIDPIPLDEKKRLVVMEDGINAGHMFHEPTWFNIRIKRSDLKDCISYIKRLNASLS